MSVLRDVLAPSLAVVFCGTAVGTASARRRAYYAGPGNAFWRTLFEVGLTPRALEPEEYKSIKRYGLGLTDLAKTISGSDRILSDEHFDRNGLRAKIRRYRPRVLAFTSKRAAEEFLGHRVGYGLLDERIGNTMLFVLPSPSGAARRYWDKKPWRELARLKLHGDLLTGALSEVNWYEVAKAFQERQLCRKEATNLRRYLLVVAAGMLLVGCVSGRSSPSSSQVDREDWQQFQEQEQMSDEGLQEAPPE